MSVHPRHRQGPGGHGGRLPMMAGLAALIASGLPLTGGRGRYTPSLPSWYRTSRKRSGPINRDQERDRRRRQIERGQLRAENGLTP